MPLPRKPRISAERLLFFKLREAAAWRQTRQYIVWRPSLSITQLDRPVYLPVETQAIRAAVAAQAKPSASARSLNDVIPQLLIGLLGVTAIWLSQDKRDHVRRFGCLFGLASQPFWFYSAWTAEQWGIFALCFFYTWAWLKGVRTFWWRKS
jgi:hypothetical protein